MRIANAFGYRMHSHRMGETWSAHATVSNRPILRVVPPPRSTWLAKKLTLAVGTVRYVRWIAQGAPSRRHWVGLVTLEYCLDHPLYVTKQRECGGRVEFDVLPDEKDLRSEKWMEVRRGADPVRREFISHNLFPNYYRIRS